jgi:hypothetical protein
MAVSLTDLLIILKMTRLFWYVCMFASEGSPYRGVSDVCVRPSDRELIEQTAGTPEMRDSTTC